MKIRTTRYQEILQERTCKTFLKTTRQQKKKHKTIASGLKDLDSSSENKNKVNFQWIVMSLDVEKFTRKRSHFGAYTKDYLVKTLSMKNIKKSIPCYERNRHEHNYNML